MIVTVHQPVFLPYLGVIKKISESDLFVILDDVEFSKSGFIHRNKIFNGKDWEWITVPVSYRNSRELIKDTKVVKNKLYRKILNKIKSVYRKAPYFDEVYPILDRHFNFYIDRDIEVSLARFNSLLLIDILEYLGIDTAIFYSSNLSNKPTNPTERNLYLTEFVGGDIYYSGANGKNYMDKDIIDSYGIDVMYQDYNCREYPQFNNKGEFIPYMSILDYIMNMGKDMSLI